jgi:hypothetical protein
MAGHESPLLRAIEAELERIGAGLSSGPESIGVNDERGGWASLGATELRRDLYWYGRAEQILNRLEGLETGAGPDAVRREFHTELPPALRTPSGPPRGARSAERSAGPP